MVIKGAVEMSTLKEQPKAAEDHRLTKSLDPSQKPRKQDVKAERAHLRLQTIKTRARSLQRISMTSAFICSMASDDGNLVDCFIPFALDHGRVC